MLVLSSWLLYQLNHFILANQYFLKNESESSKNRGYRFVYKVEVEYQNKFMVWLKKTSNKAFTKKLEI